MRPALVDALEYDYRDAAGGLALVVHEDGHDLRLCIEQPVALRTRRHGEKLAVRRSRWAGHCRVSVHSCVHQLACRSRLQREFAGSPAMGQPAREHEPSQRPELGESVVAPAHANRFPSERVERADTISICSRDQILGLELGLARRNIRASTLAGRGSAVCVRDLRDPRISPWRSPAKGGPKTVIDLQARIAAFLTAYEAAIQTQDAARLGNMYAESFAFGDPLLATTVRRDEFVKAITIRQKFLSETGLEATTLAAFDVQQLTDGYCLMNVTWVMRFRKNGHPVESENRASYVLRRRGEAWEIVVQLDHQDLAQRATEVVMCECLVRLAAPGRGRRNYLEARLIARATTSTNRRREAPRPAGARGDAEPARGRGLAGAHPRARRAHAPAHH